jgi:hypothetical protein
MYFGSATFPTNFEKRSNMKYIDKLENLRAYTHIKTRNYFKILKKKKKKDWEIRFKTMSTIYRCYFSSMSF